MSGVALPCKGAVEMGYLVQAPTCFANLHGICSLRFSAISSPPFYDLQLIWLTSIRPVTERFCQPPKLSIRENKDGEAKYETGITFSNKDITASRLPSALQTAS